VIGLMQYGRAFVHLHFSPSQTSPHSFLFSVSPLKHTHLFCMPLLSMSIEVCDMMNRWCSRLASRSNILFSPRLRHSIIIRFRLNYERIRGNGLNMKPIFMCHVEKASHPFQDYFWLLSHPPWPLFAHVFPSHYQGCSREGCTLFPQDVKK
jgi:hypothetical protein